jgi:hypothetical protein
MIFIPDRAKLLQTAAPKPEEAPKTIAQKPSKYLCVIRAPSYDAFEQPINRFFKIYRCVIVKSV